MSALHEYQAAFTAHLRQPQACAKPRGIQAKRMAVYRQIVFNNFASSVSACFPVLLSILGKRRSKQLLRLCFHSQHFASPLFRELPRALVDCLQSLDLAAHGLPPYAAQLAHYEWAELALANFPAVPAAQVTAQRIDQAHLLQGRLGLQPAHWLLAYDYPVQRLSKRHAKAEPEPTFVCMWRKADFEIEFVQLNALTYALLTKLALARHSGEQLLQQLAADMPQRDASAVFGFGVQTLWQLQQRGLVMVLD